MANSRAVFLPFAAEFPSANFPQLLLTNQRPVLAFDASTDEANMWTGTAPQGLTGNLQIVITYFMASATTGTVGFQAAIEAVTAGDALNLGTTDSFDTVNNSASTTVPGSAGNDGTITIALTNNGSMAAGDYFRLKLNRDADGSAIADTAAGDCYVLACEFQDGA